MTAPTWIEVVVAVLLVGSGLLSLIAAAGLIGMKSFFQRVHTPALASTLGTWCVTLASIVYFSDLDGGLALHAWLIAILLSITAPITTSLLARAALFRHHEAARAAGDSSTSEHSSG
jgi:multicomponent K+:H+ antiporter subunit G